jgi:hypothetical protein
MQHKIENMNKVLSLIPLIFGIGLAAMPYPSGLIQQKAYATFYGEGSSEDVMTIAYSFTPSDSKMTKQDNFTISKAHKDNPTQITK